MLLPTDTAETCMNMSVAMTRTLVYGHSLEAARKAATPRVEEGGRPS